MPDNDSSIDTRGFFRVSRCQTRGGTLLTAKLLHRAPRRLKRPQHGDGVLVNRLELRVILGLASEIHLPEHVQSRVVPVVTEARSSLGLQRPTELPPLNATLEAESLAVVTSGNDLGLAIPDEAHEGQQLSVDADDGLGRLVGTAWIHDRDAAIVRSVCERIATRRKGHGVHPTGRVVHVLATHGIEGQALAPHTRIGAGVRALDEAREDARMSVRRPRRQQNRVRMPGHRGDGASDGLLEVLRHPPVILLLKVADGDQAVARADGELSLRRRPAHKRGGAVDAEEDEGGLVALGRGLPDERIAILGACQPIAWGGRTRGEGGYPESTRRCDQS